MTERPARDGAKIPLMLVPGLLCDERLWQYQADDLLEIADSIIADVTTGASISEMAHAVIGAAPERFALAGLSMGGYVALEILRTAPARVARLALLGTSARPDTPEQTAVRRKLMKLAQDGRFDGVPRKLLPMLIHADRLEDVELVSNVLDMAESVGSEAFVRQENAIIRRPDSREDLKNIACPTLVLCGREDALTPLPLHEEMASLIPDARLRVIQGCGHLSTLERPEEVSAALREWLAMT